MPYRCNTCGRELPDGVAADHERQCGERPTDGGSSRLPCFLALPFRDYAAESHPVLRLYRLCDAVEALTRFLTAAALAELYRRNAAQSPAVTWPPRDLAPLLSQLERPTFGQWKNLLTGAIALLRPTDPPALPDLRAFTTRHLLPLIGGGDDKPEAAVLALRNLLAHGGPVSTAQAARYAAAWEERCQNLFARAAVFGQIPVVYAAAGGEWPLAGPDPDFGPATGGRVVVRGDPELSLWPLCDVGPPGSPEGPNRPPPVPLIYARTTRDRVRYSALGGDPSFADRADAVEPFRRLVPRVFVAGPPTDFAAEFAADAAAFVGRVADLSAAVSRVGEAWSDGGVLCIWGAGGLGKSYLTAALFEAADFRNESNKVVRIGWRFRAGDHRATRLAFLRHAADTLTAALKQPPAPAASPGDLEALLGRLFDRLGEIPKPPRVLVVLDGLDEIARTDPTFAELPLRLTRPGVVWVCAGRPEAGLTAMFASGRCASVFPHGLPPMSDADVRGMLLDTGGNPKYDLLRLDREEGGEVTNPAVAAVVERAAGLPLYVRYVVEDLAAGRFRAADLERVLPPGLGAYFENQLARLGVGDVAAAATPLVVTLAWAPGPVPEDVLLRLLVNRGVLPPGGEGSELLRAAVAAVEALVRAETAGGPNKFDLYHPTVREHVRADAGGLRRHQAALAKAGFVALATGWADAPAGPAREYAIRHGPAILRGAGRPAELWSLLTNPAYISAAAGAGLIWELAAELEAAARELPPDRDQNPAALRLMAEAIRSDGGFLSRHPEALPQTLWNLGWWADAPAAAAHFDPPPSGWPADGPPWGRTGLAALLAGWLARDWPAGPWLRALRPTDRRDRSVHRHGGEVWCVAAGPRGEVVSGGGDGVALVRAGDGTPGAKLGGHSRAVYAVAVSPDGRAAATGDADGRVRVWSLPSGVPQEQWPAHPAEVRGIVYCGDLLVTAGADGTIRVWNRDGKELQRELAADLPEVRGLAADPEGSLVVAACGGPDVRAWDPRSGAAVAVGPGLGPAEAVAAGPGGRLAVAAGGVVRVRGGPGGEWLTRQRPHAVAESLAFSADGSQLAAAFRRHGVIVWSADGADGIPAAGGQVNAVAWADDRLLTAARDGTVRSVVLTGGGPVLRGRGEARPDRLSFATGGRVLIGTSGDRVAAWDTETGLPVPVPGPVVEGTAAVVAGDPSGELTVRHGPGGPPIRLTRLAAVHPPDSPLGTIDAAAFSPDGTRVAVRFVPSPGRSWVGVWDAGTGNCMAALADDDVAGAAADLDAFSARTNDDQETEVLDCAGRVVARYPVALDGLAGSGRMWAGWAADGLHLIRLENPQPRQSGCVFCGGTCDGPFLAVGRGAVAGTGCLADAAEQDRPVPTAQDDPENVCAGCTQLPRLSGGALCAVCTLAGLRAAVDAAGWGADAVRDALHPDAPLRRRVAALWRIPGLRADGLWPSGDIVLTGRLVAHLGYDRGFVAHEVRQLAVNACLGLGNVILPDLSELSANGQSLTARNARLVAETISASGRYPGSGSADPERPS